jgi:hypothetical protein
MEAGSAAACKHAAAQTAEGERACDRWGRRRCLSCSRCAVRAAVVTSRSELSVQRVPLAAAVSWAHCQLHATLTVTNRCWHAQLEQCACLTRLHACRGGSTQAGEGRETARASRGAEAAPLDVPAGAERRDPARSGRAAQGSSEEGEGGNRCTQNGAQPTPTRLCLTVPTVLQPGPESRRTGIATSTCSLLRLAVHPCLGHKSRCSRPWMRRCL